MGLIEQNGLALRRPAHLHFGARSGQTFAGAINQPRACGVQRSHPRKINENCAAARFRAHAFDVASGRLHAGAIFQRPQAGQENARSSWRCLARHAWLMLQGRLRGRFLRQISSNSCFGLTPPSHACRGGGLANCAQFKGKHPGAISLFGRQPLDGDYDYEIIASKPLERAAAG